MDYSNILSKVDKLNSILDNTRNYRKSWTGDLGKVITTTLEDIIKKTKLNAYVDHKDDIENLEVYTMSLGTVASGIAEKLDGNRSKRQFIKSNGALIFQQLFNGKIMIMIMYPYIEGYGQPKPPKTIEIIRPEEMSQGYITRYVEEFLQEIIDWEDFDDDLPEKMGMTPIGFDVHRGLITDESQTVEQGK